MSEVKEMTIEDVITTTKKIIENQIVNLLEKYIIMQKHITKDN